MWHGAQAVEMGGGGSSEVAEVCGGITAGKGGGSTVYGAVTVTVNVSNSDGDGGSGGRQRWWWW